MSCVDVKWFFFCVSLFVYVFVFMFSGEQVAVWLLAREYKCVVTSQR